MSFVKLPNPPLFPRPDEELSSITPKFSKREIMMLERVVVEHYNIFGDLDGHGGTRYSVTLPKCGLVASISETGEHQYPPSNGYVGIINQFVKENPDSDVARWVAANARDLNAAKHYWEAVDLREKAESFVVRANLSILTAKAYAAGKNGLTNEERKLALIEFGYDPDAYWE